MSDLTIRGTDTAWRITLDGHNYRVQRRTWAHSGGGESWDVIVSHNDRWCDPTKPTFKRVVAAMKQHLNGAEIIIPIASQPS